MKMFLTIILIGLRFGLGAELCRNIDQQSSQIIEDDLKEIMLSTKPVILEIYAERCYYCNYLAPIFEELNEELGHMYQFAKLNVELEEIFMDEMEITTVPTIIFLKQGREIGRHIGFLNKEEFVKIIEIYMNEIKYD